MSIATEFDLGPLVWVKGEIDLALGRAAESLEQYGATGDAAKLKFAQTHLHQAHGALSIVCLDGATQVSEALEALLQDVEKGAAEPVAPSVEVLRQGIASLRHYLDELANGAPHQPLRLLPVFEQLQRQRKAAPPVASDLFFPDLSRRPPRREGVLALSQEQMHSRLKAARAHFERGFLQWLRSTDGVAGLAEMRESLGAIEAVQATPAERNFWWIALAFLDVLAEKSIAVDLPVKRLCARIDTQMRRYVEGTSAVSDRLLRDLLYYVAVAPTGGDHTAEVKGVFGLDAMIPNAAASGVEAFRSVLLSLRETLQLAKDSWNKFCAGAAVGLPQFDEHTAQLAGRAAGLPEPALVRLLKEIHATAQWLRKDPLQQSEPLAMELATALLLAESGVDNFERLDKDFNHQVVTVAERLAALRNGEVLAPLDAPLLGEISRQAQEKLFLSQVAREILANLSQIEQTLDGYFRDPSRSAELTQLAAPLKQIKGALTMLGHDTAVALVGECDERIAEFAAAGAPPAPGELESVAHKLSGLGFFVEALQHGPADLESILYPERARQKAAEAAASLEAELDQKKGAAQALADRLRDQPQDSALRQELKETFETIRQEANLVADPKLEKQARDALTALAESSGPATDTQRVVQAAAEMTASVTPMPVPTPVPAPQSEEAVDSELLAIFLEEANEVLGTIDSHLAASRNAPQDHEALTTIRRGFHTLKGSGRMVGLKELGEAAWSAEQVMNQWLRTEEDATDALHRFIAEAHTVLFAWIKQLEAGGSTHMDAAALIAHAEILKSGGDGEQSPVPTAPPAEAPVADPALTAPPAEVLAEVAEPDAPLVEAVPEMPEAVPLLTEATAEIPAPSDTADTVAETAPVAEAPPAVEEAVAAPAASEDVVRIGDVTMSPTLFEMFLGEARQHLATLRHELARMRLNPSLQASPDTIRAAHTLAGIAGTVGLGPVHDLGRSLEHALGRLSAMEMAPDLDQSEVLNNAATVLEGMVSAVADKRRPVPLTDLFEWLDAIAPDAGATMISAPVAEIISLDDDFELGDEAFAQQPVVEDLVLDEPEAFIATTEAESEPAVTPAEVEPELPIAPPPAVSEPPVVPVEAEPELLVVPTRAEPEPPVAPIPMAYQLPDTPTHIMAAPQPAPAPTPEDRRKLRLPDDIDPQLLPLFIEESSDLMSEITAALGQWRTAPEDNGARLELARLLHTLKGSARMAGAMAVGELVHSLENRVQQAESNAPSAAFFDDCDHSLDRANALLDQLREPSQVPEPAAAARPAAEKATAPATVEEDEPLAQRATLRVRADLVDRFVNEAGEISIARSRVDGEMRVVRGSLLDLTENVIRLRNQLREVEIQAETQMQSRMALADAHQAEFDPLEMDRFTRLQELTRMMAESVNDLSTVQQNLLRNLDSADAALTAQGRLTRDLQQSLMNVRMVPFSSVADRLHRIVRQTAKELDRRANLDIRGGQIELDRSVLEKITGPLEHLLRNSISHGLEDRDQRLRAGKPEIGGVTLSLAQEGNEIAIDLADDGRGLDLHRIRQRGYAAGFLSDGETPDESRLIDLIFRPGFTTATELSEIAGRGVGMDVVKNAVYSLGGRIEVTNQPGKGVRFRILLPQSLVVMQALLARVGGRTYAIPSSMVDQVLELKADALEQMRAAGEAIWMGNHYPFRYLARLLGDTESQPPVGRYSWIILTRAAGSHVATLVDGLRGNQEIVIKKTGPQLARVVGVAGATVLADGEISLILNPVALLSAERRLGTGAVAETPRAPSAPVQEVRQPTIMVVDDSLTVRKITSRLLEREGMLVVTAKDGVDALEQLLDVVPDVMLVDIEMPRMDGFDLTRNVRSDPKLKAVPIIMITSRLADKHRNYAKEIGVNHYLGKPYQDDELMALIRSYTEAKVPA